jgi:hypothetical protein
VTQYFRDFSEYTTGEIDTATPDEWSEQSSDVDWTFLVTSDGSATGGQTLVIDNDDVQPDSNNILLFTPAGSTTGDIEVVARMKLSGVGGPDKGRGPGLFTTTDNAYVCGLDTLDPEDHSGWESNDTLVISTRIGSAKTLTIATETWFWHRIGRSGTTIRWKVWLDSSSEPGGWDDSATNTALSTVAPGLCLRDNDDVPFTIDVFGVGTAGDEAPKTGAGTIITVPTGPWR